MRLLTLVVGWIALAPAFVLAAPLQTVLSTTEPVPGEPFELVVMGRMPAAVTVVDDNYPTALSDWAWRLVTREVLSEQGNSIIQDHLRLRVDREGLYLVRPIVWTLCFPDGATAQARARRRFVEVPPGAAARLELRPEHPLRRIRRTLAEWLPWALAALSLFGGFGVSLWWRRRHRRPVVEDPFERLAQDCAALLSRYRELDKDSAFALSEIARRYVEQRTGLPALEWTGAELSAAMRDWLAAQPSHAVWLEPVVGQVCALEAIKYRPPHAPEAALTEAVDLLQRAARQAETLLSADSDRQEKSQ